MKGLECKRNTGYTIIGNQTLLMSNVAIVERDREGVDMDFFAKR